MACSDDVGTRLMDCGVDLETSCVGWTSQVPADGSARVVKEDHVRGLEEAEVPAEWVCPERMGVFWVTDGDVALPYVSISDTVG